MKKRLVVCLLFLGVSSSPLATIQSSACGNVEYTVTTLASENGWDRMFVRGYDSYGRYIHILEVIAKYQNGQWHIKARLEGTSEEFRYAIYGPFKCGDTKYAYKVNIGSDLYFDLISV